MLDGARHAGPVAAAIQAAAAQRVPTVPTPVTPTPAPDIRVPGIEVGEVSRADGPWEVDWARARADAERVLAQIDWSRRDIVIWVPGTSNDRVHPDFETAVHDSWTTLPEGGAGLILMGYEASWHLRRSLPTGIATMMIVLERLREELAKRGGDHRVLLGGESQGAWIIGEALRDGGYSDVVDRAILMGHPWLAATQYADGQDPRVAVVNNDGDQVTMPVKGDVTRGLDAMIAIRTLDLAKAGDVLGALKDNPAQGVSLLKSILFQVPVLKHLIRDPHKYGHHMTRAVEFLRFGTDPNGVRRADRPEVAAAAEAQLAAYQRASVLAPAAA